MVAESLLDISLEDLLKGIERRTGVKLSRKVIKVSLNNGVLHIRFAYPKKREANVEPLPLKTPAYLFKDEETGEITALEVLAVEEALSELKD